MSVCCGVAACEAGPARGRDACPLTGARGRRVGSETVKALLTEAALRRFEPGQYRFCSEPACEVVYYDGQGRTFAKGDIRVPVWQKEPFGERLVCYCFGENEADMRREWEKTGRIDAVARVRAHIQAGRCACEVRNPRGVCCLRDVAAAAKRIMAGVRAPVDA